MGVRSVERRMSDGDWQTIEAKFRVWSFHVYYEKSFASEPDLTLRFAKALAASSQPIRDRRLVYDWHEKRKARKRAPTQAIPA